jgi:sulfite exporter TauE/SafE
MLYGWPVGAQLLFWLGVAICAWGVVTLIRRRTTAGRFIGAGHVASGGVGVSVALSEAWTSIAFFLLGIVLLVVAILLNRRGEMDSRLENVEPTQPAGG